MRWIRHRDHWIRVPDTMQKVERDGYTETSEPQTATKKPSSFNRNAPLIDEEAVEGFNPGNYTDGEEGGSGSR